MIVMKVVIGVRSGGLGVAGRGGDDIEEAARVKRGAPDQEAVDVAGGEQLGSVAGLDATTVKQRSVSTAKPLFVEPAADDAVHGAGLLGGRRSARADRPDRLVGDRHARRIELAGQLRERGTKL